MNPKHENLDELWRAYCALCGTLVPGTTPHPDVAPALNILLSCLRAAGAAVGPDFPDPNA